MNAWVLHGIDEFRFENTKLPVLGEREVLVQVKAAGICGSDIPRIYKTGTYSYPLIPGHEFSGKIKEIGTRIEKKWKGKRVGIFPLIPCQTCIACQRKQYELCRNYSYLGSRRNGGFAEYVAVPIENVVELPDSVSYEEAAMLEPMAVALHALKRISIEPTDTIVIYGLGTIGMLVLLFLLEAGKTKILVIGNKEFQKQTVLRMGLSEACYCDSKTQVVKDWVLEHTNGIGAEVCLECIGKSETIAQMVDIAAPLGKLCFIGNPYSDIIFEKSVYWKILRNQLTITGTWNSSLENDWYSILQKLEQKKIRPAELISHRYSIENLEQGLHIMRDKTEDYMKIMMKNTRELF